MSEKQQGEEQCEVDKLEKMEPAERRKYMVGEAIEVCEIVIKREEGWLKVFEDNMDTYDPVILPIVKEWIRRLKKNIEGQRRTLEFTRNNESVTEGNLITMMESFSKDEGELVADYQAELEKRKKVLEEKGIKVPELSPKSV